MKNTTYVIVTILAVLAIGCGTQPEQSAEADAHAHEAPANEEEVHLLQNQMDVMQIELGKFQYLDLSTTVRANGQLELPPQNKASVSAVMGGRIKSIGVKAGDLVQQGQVLATLERPEFIEMQEAYLSNKARAAHLQKTFERKQELYRDSLGSIKELDQAEAAHQSALAALNASKAKMKMLHINLTALDRGELSATVPVISPINGYVRHIDVNMGQFVQPEEELFEIVDNEHIHIDLRVYEKDMDKVRKGQKVIFSLSTSPDSIFQGSIFAVGRAFEEKPKAMVVHAEIDNPSGDLLPGMYVDARIVTSSDTAKALPNDAIVSDGGLQYIFVLKPASTKGHTHGGEEHAHENEYIFRKMEVNTGASDIGFTEVVPAYNLPDHVQFVTKGAFYLLAEMKKGEGGHGHHH